MQLEWTNLLLQGFAGGITGYVTNNYALNMLFREYTPLKLGGVIKKTKSEFIDAISELVERDLLSPSHLKNEFLKEEALEEWNILFASLWDEFFQAEFQQVPLNEIRVFKKPCPLGLTPSSQKAWNPFVMDGSPCRNLLWAICFPKNPSPFNEKTSDAVRCRNTAGLYAGYFPA